MGRCTVGMRFRVTSLQLSKATHVYVKLHRALYRKEGEAHGYVLLTGLR